MTGLLFFNCFPASRIYSGKAQLEKCFQEWVSGLAGPGSLSAPREVRQPGPPRARLLPRASALSLKAMVPWSEMQSRVMTAKVWMRERRPGSDLVAGGPRTES